MHSIQGTLSLALVTLTLAVGCERKPERNTEVITPPVAEPRGGGPGAPEALPSTLTVESALVKLATMRCAREETCGHIGLEKRHFDHPACVSAVRKDLGEDLNTKDCPGGVSQAELDACLASLGAEECRDPLDKIQRAAACRSSKICVK